MHSTAKYKSSNHWYKNVLLMQYLFFFCSINVSSLTIKNFLPPCINDTKWHYRDIFSYPDKPIFNFFFFLLAAVVEDFFDFLYLLPASSFYKGIIDINYIVIRHYFYCPVNVFALTWLLRYDACSAELPEC